MNNQNQVGTDNQVVGNIGEFSLFNRLPMPLVVGYFQLYSHFLDKGDSNQGAATKAWTAIQESLPVIRNGMTTLGINIERAA